MRTHSCRCCGSEGLSFSFRAKVLGKYDADYLVCDTCELMQVKDPSWLSEAYEESINVSDTGIMARNLAFRDMTAISLFVMQGAGGIRSSKYMDFGGGYGVFVRLMRDIGFDFYWSDEYSDNLFARGFEANHGSYEALVAFEVFEHLALPMQVFRDIFSRTSTLIFSTELYGAKPPATEAWEYYGLSHGQHITFYNYKTLSYLASEFDMNLSTDGIRFHVLTKNRITKSHIRKVQLLRRAGLMWLLGRMFDSKIISDNRFLIDGG